MQRFARHGRPTSGFSVGRGTGLPTVPLRGMYCLLIALLAGGLGCRREPSADSERDRSAVPVADSPAAKRQEDAELADRAEEEVGTSFTDVTARTGIDFRFSSGREAGEFAILESLGGGVGAFDFDRDGDVDLMFAGGGTLDDKRVGAVACALYRNRGELRFEDTTLAAGAKADAFYNHGIFPGDFDSDGFADLAVSGYGGVQILRNQGDGTFAPFDTWQTHPEHPWSSSLAWCDIEGDGLLDLYVTHYVDWSWKNHPACPGPGGVSREVCPPREFEGVTDVIYRNQGNGTFKAVSEAAGLAQGGKGLGVVAGDVNRDGDIDIYVANDTTDNFYYQNDGTGTFEEIAMVAGVATDEVGVNTGSMGIALQDLDSDGLPDVWVTNFERELFAYYRNDGGDLFSHASRAAGLAALKGLYVGFGTVATDIDGDGDRDLVVANGHVSYASPHAEYRQPPLLLENHGGMRFEQSDEGGYFADTHTGRGLAAADLDNDGRMDLIFTHLEEPVSLLRSVRPASSQWALVELVGTRSNRDAIGASVMMQTKAGTQVWLCNSGGSYLSQSDRRILLATMASDVEEVSVFWPSGKRETFPFPESATGTVWIEGTGKE